MILCLIDSLDCHLSNDIHIIHTYTYKQFKNKTKWNRAQTYALIKYQPYYSYRYTCIINK